MYEVKTCAVNNRGAALVPLAWCSGYVLRLNTNTSRHKSPCVVWQPASLFVGDREWTGSTLLANFTSIFLGYYCGRQGSGQSQRTLVSGAKQLRLSLH